MKMVIKGESYGGVICRGKVMEVAERILRALSNENLYITQKSKSPLIDGLRLLFIVSSNKGY